LRLTNIIFFLLFVKKMHYHAVFKSLFVQVLTLLLLWLGFFGLAGDHTANVEVIKTIFNSKSSQIH
jgi:hypothetical protein